MSEWVVATVPCTPTCPEKLGVDEVDGVFAVVPTFGPLTLSPFAESYDRLPPNVYPAMFAVAPMLPPHDWVP